ncbi:phosphoesterase PA-phosphatase related protein [Halalkaliarchaeum desulfuricum]|uniref:Phosphoesterase PA-phosphatase related protein n=1 Tax=Halalkaliarchaeum desulfuricum TaxID=2055893 RepID=A0A343TIC5_9EURY|nr:phosphatase PAP2 family protein [Halalkaliarchaeum desulfuricum]AUX08847.1 phosphoesterase PA-phosphatase related protein [Halalkaliarchaeum desulfuricum]
MSRGLGVTVALRESLPEWTATLFAAVSVLGDLAVIVPVLGVLYLVDVGESLRESHSHDGEEPLCSDRTAFLIATVFGGLALIVLLKATFALPRPPTELHAVVPSEHGFPSGHTMAATVFWGALALWTTVGRRRPRFATAATVVGLVGVSRMALGVHYLVDVFASVGFGTAYLAGMWYLARGIPVRAFVIAAVVALLSLAVTGGETRALLATAGTIGAAVGWWTVERAPVERRLRAAFAD